jgi:HlyD family secretion protein
LDIPREKTKKPTRFILPAVGILAVVAITIGVTRMKPRAPSVNRAVLHMDEVKRGELLRQVRATGTLVPEQIRWISAVTSGRVEQILARPGVEVNEGTVLMILTNPDVQMEQLNAQRQLSTEINTLVNLRTQLETQRLTQQGAVATAYSAMQEARRQLQTNEELASKNLIAGNDLARSRDVAQETAQRHEYQRKQLELFEGSIAGQIAAQEDNIRRARAIAEFQAERVASMRVVAGAKGILTELPLEVGQWANSGATLAKVVEPDRLKAVLRVPETQMRDVRLGQRAMIDTRNGVIEGRVVRIDPAVQAAAVAVDIELEGDLPPSARPDLSVDGTIELERLPDVLYMARPAFGQAESTVELFKLTPDGKEAYRVRVQFGVSSVQAVEIRSGLEVGDRVILSDMSQWDTHDRVRIQ